MGDGKQDAKKDNQQPLPQRSGAPGRGGGRGGKFEPPQHQRPKFGNQNQNQNQPPQHKPQPQHQQQKERNGMGGPNPGQDHHEEHPQRGGGGGRGGGRGGGVGGRGGYRGNRPDGRGSDMNESRMGGGGGGDRYFTEKIMAIQGPTLDLPPSEPQNKDIKFANNCRLYLGNIGGDITENDIIELFKPYGETQELFINKEKMFGFIRMDYKHNADKAKAKLDGHVLKGRSLKIRFAPINAAIKVKNLTSCVTNELLELAFGVFGDIERAIVIVDERGNSKCEGIVEFARKPAAAQALRRCAEGCFFLTQSLRPVIVEPLELTDEIDGLSERTINKKTPEFYKQRQVGPRFATVNSFEFEYGSRWKQLHELFKQKEEALQRELKMEEEKLEAQMEYARYEHETEMLRKELAQREIDRERQKAEWEMKERQAEELKRRDEELMKKHAEEMQLRLAQQEEDLRRRQNDNSMFLVEQQQGRGGSGGYGSPGQAYGNANIDFEALAAAVGNAVVGNVTGVDNKGSAMDFEQGGRSGGGGGRRNDSASSGWSRREGGAGRWGPSVDHGSRRGGSGGGGPTDYQPKRRRY
ncbi:hypothetical protein M8J77_006595 [Diaphorina citri]|nr:hypothetical protein M8J77_006595 [Diaphorina citri]